jgi:hypothetical protein
VRRGSRLTKRKRNRRKPPSRKLRERTINQIAADEEEDCECVIRRVRPFCAKGIGRGSWVEFAAGEEERFARIVECGGHARDGTRILLLVAL